MKMENKIKDIIDMLEEALSFEDWRKVENAQKELTRAIAFPTMYKMSLAKMREGMKCKVVLSTLDDGTLMVKEIK